MYVLMYVCMYLCTYLSMYVSLRPSSSTENPQHQTPQTPDL